MANRFRKLKMEASTPSQACLPWETGESGPLGPTSYFGRGIQRRSSFLKDTISKKCRNTSLSSKSVSDAIYSKTRLHFRMKQRHIAGNLLLIYSKNRPHFRMKRRFIARNPHLFFLRNWQHRKKIERCPRRKEERV